MSFVDELDDKLASLKAKATGEIESVAGNLEDVFHKLVDDDGVGDKVTEEVAKKLHAVADKLSAVADKISGAFEPKTTPGATGTVGPEGS